MSWKTRGMNQDLSVSAFNPEFSFENRNLRLSTNENNTQLSWVNEKGTEEILEDINDNPINILGTPIGTAIINHKLVLFTCGNTTAENGTTYPDHIYIIRIQESKIIFHTIYRGNLDLDKACPLETLVSYETDSIQKVYWVDGKNQPRIINVRRGDGFFNYGGGIDTQFDFTPTFTLPSQAVVVKRSSGGTFAPGVIQYCFTYNCKYGQQSNIVWVSPLNYISPADRGGRPDENISNSFTITITAPDKDFDFIRLYSIQRTSVNAVPIVKRVTDIEIPSTVTSTTTLTYIDDGTTGDIVDAQQLLYIGGREIIAQTMTDKDQTLFLGNITQKNAEMPDIGDYYTAEEEAEYEEDDSIRRKGEIYFDYRNLISDSSVSKDVYHYNVNLKDSAEYITTFKGGEYYRFGYQLQRKTGEWTEPIWLQDKQNILYPETNSVSAAVVFAKTTLDLDSALGSGLDDYIAARPLIVYPEINDRTVLCQGVLNPTVFNAKSRLEGTIFSQSSWFFRPYTYTKNISSWGNMVFYPYGDKAGSVLTFKHYASLPQTISSFANYQGSTTEDAINTYNEQRVEIQGAIDEVNGVLDGSVGSTDLDEFKSNTQFFVDQSIVTLHSPDVEFDTEVQSVSYADTWKLRIIGLVPLNSYASYHNIIRGTTKYPTSYNSEGEDNTPEPDYNFGAGELNNNVTHTLFSNYAGKRFISNLIWEDSYIQRSYKKDATKITSWDYCYNYMIYPWQRTGSLNGDKEGDDSSSVLKTKKFSHLLFSYTSNYFKTSINPGIEMYEKTGSEYESLGIVTNYTIPGTINASIHLTENSYVHTIRLPYSAGENASMRSINYYPNIDEVLYNNRGYYVHLGSESLVLGPPFPVISNSVAPISMKYKSTSHIVLGLDTILPGGLLSYGQVIPAEDIIGDPAVSSGNAFWGQSFDFGNPKFIDLSAYRGGTDYELSWLWLGELYRDYNPATMFGGNSDEAKRNNTWLIGGEVVPITNDNKTAVELQWTYGDTYYQRYDCLKTYPFTPEDENQNTEILSFMCETHVNIDGRYDRNRGLIDNTNVSPVNFNLLNPVYTQKDNYFSYKILDHEANTKGTYPNWVTYTQTKQSGADVDEWTHLTLGSVLEMDGDKGEVRSLQRFNNQVIAFQDRGISQILYNENVQINSTEGVPIEIANSGKVQGKRYFTDTIGCTNKWSICSTPLGLYFMDSHAKSIFLFNGQINNLSVNGGFNTWSKKNITDSIWKPYPFTGFVSYYDPQNQEVLFINNVEALAFSEKFNAFTSFYDYGGAPYFNTLDGVGLWVNNSNEHAGQYGLYFHQQGEYCNFFGALKPYGITLVGNPEPQLDKVFTNMEFRACVDGDGETVTSALDAMAYYQPYLPFDYLAAWNEYQRGITVLGHRNGVAMGKHHDGSLSSLKRKFRIWRCDIPRDGMGLGSTFDFTFDETFQGQQAHRGLNRMRNPWLYLKFQKVGEPNKRVEIHDLLMTYYR